MQVVAEAVELQPEAEHTGPYVVAFPTIMDGYVLRWYGSESAALSGGEYMSAGREGVLVHTYLGNVDPEQLAVATEVADLLKRDYSAGVTKAQEIATHRRAGPLFRPSLELIVREA